MKEVKIKKITYVGTGKVRNLTVEKNHTFITENGIISHNCDRMQAAQEALKALMEQCEANCRFILTTNNLAKIIEPIRSRTHFLDYNFSSKDSKNLMMAYCKRIFWILDQEKIEYEKKTVAEFVQKIYPDFRKILNELQKFVTMHGKVTEAIFNSMDDSLIGNIIQEIKDKKFNNVRKLAVEIDPSSFYGTFYSQLDEHLQNESKPEAILLLSKYAYESSLSVCPEITMVACCTELMRLKWR